MKKAKFIKPLTITLDEETYTIIKNISDVKEVSMSEIARDLLKVGIQSLKEVPS
jgi:hypothetical protein